MEPGTKLWVGITLDFIWLFCRSVVALMLAIEAVVHINESVNSLVLIGLACIIASQGKDVQTTLEKLNGTQATQ